MNRIQGKRWKPGLATAFAGAVLAVLAMAVAPSALAAPGAPAPAGTGTSAPAGPGALVPPGEDPFYRPPPGLPAYPPGAVLRVRQVTLQGAMQPQLKAAYQLLYRTTDPSGRAFPALGLPSLLNASGRALAAVDGQDADGCAGATSNAQGGNAAEYTIFPTSEALAAYPGVKRVLDKLTMETAAPVPAAPSFFYNAVGDELAHIQPVDKLVAYYCARGATIAYDRDPVADSHVAGLTAYWPPALQYIENRFAGQPAPDTCPPPAHRGAG